ncbi:MAG: serine--tRNA ligase [Deltaproteobacteria bacterium CG11_big_fil_rev_8_21_14_0_20_45_16]|nr:MAG: serine--tRNA ligase [Deltaproteobacteria bacterium CG11_big_fil_rev_8_21_14_0_20_45_16]
MFDLKNLETDFDRYAKGWQRRQQVDLLSAIDGLKNDLIRRKQLIQEKEELLAKRNRGAEEVAKRKKAGEDISGLIDEQKAIGPRLKAVEAEWNEFEGQLSDKLSRLPNIPNAEVPFGKSEEDNQEVARVGDIRKFDFDILSHDDLGTRRQWIDFDRATHLSGSRFSVLRAEAARMERALIQFMLDLHTQEHGYEEIQPPLLVNEKTLYGTGNLPKFHDDLFKVERFDLFLIPTAEVPLSNLYADTILDEKDLPKYLTAYTPCFRSEAGSYGKDLKGLIRQHQFNKVELVKICHPEKSNEEHDKMRQNAEKILELLELPYRTVVLCTGDMGFASAKTFDIEVWLPSQNRYREISSVSNCGEFQARRMKTRFRDSQGKIHHVHTLNGSGLAVGRTLIAILENYQQKDGSVEIPRVLRPYMAGKEKI